MPATVIGPVDGVGVLGAGTAFPPLGVSNEQALAALPGRRDPARLAFAARGLSQSIGLRHRAWSHVVGQPLDHDAEWTSLALGIEAARAALDDAGVAASALSLVLFATSTPHRMTSTLSAPLGAAIGADAACMDTRTGCSAGLFALATASLYLGAGTGPVLIVGADTFSKVLPPTHKMAVMALGDGAGALVLGRKPGASVRSVYMRSDGSLGSLIGTDGALPPTAAEIDRGGYQLSGQPDALAGALPGRYLDALEGAFARAGVAPTGVDLYAPHQTSVPLIRGVAEKAGVPAESVWTDGVGNHANIGAAGWIVALAEARAAGRARPGDTVATASVGGGMSWAAAVLGW